LEDRLRTLTGRALAIYDNEYAIADAIRSRYAAYKRILSLTWGAIDRRCVRIATCRDFPVATQRIKQHLRVVY
jgi:hypothetical protein